MSLVAGSVISQKNLQRMKLILDGAKIQYTCIDISLEEHAEHKKTMLSKSKAKVPTATPQVFLNGEYVADFETIDEWNEYEELKQKMA